VWGKKGKLNQRKTMGVEFATKRKKKRKTGKKKGGPTKKNKNKKKSKKKKNTKKTHKPPPKQKGKNQRKKPRGKNVHETFSCTQKVCGGGGRGGKQVGSEAPLFEGWWNWGGAGKKKARGGEKNKSTGLS